MDLESRSIDWIAPYRTAEEEKGVLSQIQLLRSRSALQNGWDNFSTSRLLDNDADLLKGRLVHKA